jgi:iron(III) transport system substrate-binding protein
MHETNALKTKIWILALVLVAFLENHPFANAAEQPAVIDGARKEGNLMIYSLLAVPDHSKIVNRFKEKYPFIEVSLIRPGASERITARIMTEGRAGRHLVDIIGVSHLNMLQLIRGGLVMSYDSPERQQFDPAFKDKKGLWTAFYVNPEVMAYNTQLVPAATAPKNYQDLLDARWKGKLVLEQTAVEWFAVLVQRWA